MNRGGFIKPYQARQLLEVVEKCGCDQAYLIELSWTEEDGGFIAVAPDLPECSAYGDTAAELIREMEDAMQSWLQACQAMGRPVPKPHTCCLSCTTISFFTNHSLMSGIAGIIHFDGKPVEPGLIEKMTSAMAHCGLDGIHHWVKRSVALGQWMLSRLATLLRRVP